MASDPDAWEETVDRLTALRYGGCLVLAVFAAAVLLGDQSTGLTLLGLAVCGAAALVLVGVTLRRTAAVRRRAGVEVEPPYLGPTWGSVICGSVAALAMTGLAVRRLGDPASDSWPLVDWLCIAGGAWWLLDNVRDGVRLWRDPDAPALDGTRR